MADELSRIRSRAKWQGSQASDGPSASVHPDVSDERSLEGWLAKERRLNGPALCRGCASLWLCLLIGFSPAIWALLTGLLLLTADSLGVTQLASQPLPSSTALGAAADMMQPVSPAELQALRREAVDFMVSHPGVIVVSGPGRGKRDLAQVRRGGGRKGSAWHASNPHSSPNNTATARMAMSAAAIEASSEWSQAQSPYSAAGESAHRGVFDDSDYEPLGVISLDDLAIVPRLVHQTWKDAHVPAKWLQSHRSWQASYGEVQPLTVVLWSDVALRDFLDRFFPWFIPRYDGYGANIQRVDAVRYFILYAVGGVYADLDVTFRENVRWSAVLRAEMTLPLTAPLGVSNDLMAAAPHHPFFAHLCRRLGSPLAAPGWLYTRFFTVMFSTGPCFVSLQLLDYRAQRSSRGLAAEALPAAVGPPGAFWFLPPGLYDGGKESLVGHIDGRSWHDSTTTFLWALYSVLPEVGALPLVIAIIFVAITTVVVLLVMAIGWSPCCQRREARALVCCLNRTLWLTVCLGQPARPTVCPWAAEPMHCPPDNPRPGRGVMDLSATGAKRGV